MINIKKTSFLSILVYAFVLLQLTALVSTNQVHATTLNPGKPDLEVEIDVGSVHFRGEVAEFYILVSLSGNRLDVGIRANLYHKGTLNADLTSLVEHVDTGFYRIPYTVPYHGSAGAYTLVIDASFSSFAGTSLKSFLLSQTLTGWNAWLTEIRDKTASIETDVGLIELSLENLNAKLTRIDGNIATIQTEMGTIKANINDIGLTITEIEGNIATIVTSLGNIQGIITLIQGNIAIIKTDIG